MEKVLVLFSVPIFLLIVLLLAVFVLAKYSGNEKTAKTAPAEVKASGTTEGADNVKIATAEVKAPDTTEDADNVSNRG